MSEETENDERMQDFIVKSGGQSKPVVFLDTTFLRSITQDDSRFLRLLDLSKEGIIQLCISQIVAEEWRTQEANKLWYEIDRATNRIEHLWETNFLAKTMNSLDLRKTCPDRQKIKEHSKDEVKKFWERYLIEVVPSAEEHILKTWGAYFDKGPPFKGEKENDDASQKRRKDIPDAWIYQAAMDVKRKYGPNCEYITLYKNDKGDEKQGQDANLTECLKNEGFKSQGIGVFIRNIDAALASSPFSEEASREPIAFLRAEEESAQSREPPSGQGPLDQIIASGRSTEIQKIYLRVLGYTHWLDGPGKQGLINLLTERGHKQELIEASIAMLKEDPLAPIKDTGNHILPNDKTICQQAADRTKDEVLWLLEQESFNG